MNQRPNWVFPLIIVASALLFYFPFLGSAHLFDWDEINFAESAREMIASGNYTRVQINFMPFWEKPPLFFWLQSLSMHIWGINEYAARFPNAVFGLITLLTIYFIGKNQHSQRFGFYWALAFLGSFLPHLYFKSGIIDPVFNYFIFTSVYFLYKTIENKGNPIATRYTIFSGLLIGLAILTKGPVGLLLLLLTFGTYWTMSGFKRVASAKNIALFALSAFAVAFFWFGLETLKNGPSFLQEFIKYQVDLFLHPVAGQEQPFYYHFVVVLLGCFPISVLAMPYFAAKEGDEGNTFRRWMLILFWVVLILFSIVKTKIVHYSSMCYLPLSYLAALSIDRLLDGTLILKTWMRRSMLIFGIIFGSLLTLLPIVALKKEFIFPLIKDQFAVEGFKNPVYWSGFEFLIGLSYILLLIIAFYYIRKQQLVRGFILLFYSTALCLLVFLYVVVPKIEAYSQGPCIKFFKSHAGKDEYVYNIDFDTYARFYYFEKPFNSTKLSNDEDSLMMGRIDKPAYFIFKCTNTEKADPKRSPGIEYIGKDGGFVFYRRLPK